MEYLIYPQPSGYMDGVSHISGGFGVYGWSISYIRRLRGIRMEFLIYPEPSGYMYGVGVRGGRSLRRTALRFEGVASPPVHIPAAPILQVDDLRVSRSGGGAANPVARKLPLREKVPFS